MSQKKFEFINKTAKKAFLALPGEVKYQFSLDLQAVANGKAPFSAFKDISTSVGTGAIELIENGSPAYRAVYCAKYLDTVFVLHAFTKTAQGTDKANMATAEKRHKDMMARVNEAKKQAKKDAKSSKKKR